MPLMTNQSIHFGSEKQKIQMLSSFYSVPLSTRVFIIEWKQNHECFIKLPSAAVCWVEVWTWASDEISTLAKRRQTLEPATDEVHEKQYCK